MAQILFGCRQETLMSTSLIWIVPKKVKFPSLIPKKSEKSTGWTGDAVIKFKEDGLVHYAHADLTQKNVRRAEGEGRENREFSGLRILQNIREPSRLEAQ